MRKLMTLAIAAVVALPFLAFGQSEGYYDRSYTRLSFVKGDVFVQRAQDLGYEQGEVNLVVVQGDKLGTRDGRAEIQLGLGNILRLDLNTQVDIVGLPSRDGDPTKLHLLSGSVFFRVRSVDREKNLQIHTPDASFYILEAGLYRATISNDRETEFSVLSGQAEAAGEEGSRLVQEGEMVVVSDGRFAAEQSVRSDRGDDFASWNESRDALYARRLSRTYLPIEYSEYDSELSDYGRWSYESEYGYVWTPTVIYNDWRPYSNGRWSWYPMIGWTWISYEPWGWCTSHYGRWGWRFGLGWYWIPQSRWSWGPAWVHWYQGYDHIGWCPLSYYNRPAVILNNVFYNRYDRGDFPYQSRTLTVVNRNQLQNRRLSQVALDDRSVRTLGRISLRPDQPSLRPSIDRNSDLAGRARNVLNRDGLRSVGKNFSSDGRRLTPSELRSPSIRKSEAGDPGRDRIVNGGSVPSNRAVERGNDATSRRITERAIRPRSGDEGGSVSDRGSSRVVERDGTRVTPSRSGDRQPNREVAPSRAPSNPTPKSDDANRSPRVVKENESRAPKEKERETTGTVIKKDESSRSGLRERMIRERPGSSVSPLASRTSPRTTLRETNPSRLSSPTDRYSMSNGRSSSRISEMPSRRVETPSRITSYPSRNSSDSPRISSPSPRISSSLPRNSSVPSRISSPQPRASSGSSRTVRAPSRESSAPSRIISSPSRSSSSSRIAPSRSSSAPSRSVSAPSRSSSSPSRSVGAPSRSSSPSRSSTRSSGGSRSSGSVRRK